MGESTMAINRRALSTVAGDPSPSPLFCSMKFSGSEIFQIFRRARQRFEIAPFSRFAMLDGSRLRFMKLKAEAET